MTAQQCSSRPSSLSSTLEYTIKNRFSSGYYDTTYAVGSEMKNFFAMVKLCYSHDGEPLVFSYKATREAEINNNYNIFESLSFTGSFSKVNNATRVVMASFFGGSNSLKGFRDKKGHFYYSGDGIILNKNRQPIFLAAVTFNNRRIVTAVHIYVPSDIFQRSGLVEKYIAKTLIPWFSSLKTIWCNGAKVPISVCLTDMINDYIVIPAQPDENNQEGIAKFLNDNVNYLTRTICSN